MSAPSFRRVSTLLAFGLVDYVNVVGMGPRKEAKRQVSKP